MTFRSTGNDHLTGWGMSRRDFLRVGGGLAGAALLGSGTLAGCGGGSSDGGGLTMWTRAAAEQLNQLLVREWNKGHDQKIKLTIIPDDQYVTKVSTSGASGDLPDLLSVDLIYMPQFNDAEIMADISERVDGLSFRDALSPAHMDLGEWEGGQYGVPYGIDNSALFYNRGLFEEAGLDPNSPPESWQDIRGFAEEVSGLGGKNSGFYFPGNCGGCNGFTALPLVWAQGADALSGDGRTATFDTPEMVATLEFYRGMVVGGLVADGAKSDAGESWASTFASGNVAMSPGGTFFIPSLAADAPDLDFDNTFLVGPDGEPSSFGGGDVIGISAASENQETAWGYIEWMLSEETQVEVLAKNGFMVDRTDLASNRYASERIELMNRTLEFARTPKSLASFQLFNDPNGPWINMFNSAVFGGDVAAAVNQGQQRAQQILDEAYG